MKNKETLEEVSFMSKELDIEKKRSLKQETLEKYIEREFQFNSSTVIQNQEYVYLMNKNRFKIAVNNILKYQKEQDKNKYSEEDMKKSFNGFKTGKSFEEWFEQFKKK